MILKVINGGDINNPILCCLDQVLAPLPIGFAVFVVHLALIPITGTGINPARSLGAAVVKNAKEIWDDHVSPSSSSLASIYHKK